MRKLFGRLYLRLIGWKADGELPSEPRFILIAAPHTSNWDLPHMLFLSFVYGVRINWFAKHTIFRRPYGWFFRMLGGVSVDRRSPQGLVEQMADELRRRDRMILAVPPEGTRSYREYWKSGFYYIAHHAGVPIALGFLDYGGKRGGFGPLVHTTGDVQADMDKIRAFYADKVGKRPELHSRILLRTEEEEAEGGAETDAAPDRPRTPALQQAAL